MTSEEFEAHGAVLALVTSKLVKARLSKPWDRTRQSRQRSMSRIIGRKSFLLKSSKFTIPVIQLTRVDHFRGTQFPKGRLVLYAGLPRFRGGVAVPIACECLTDSKAGLTHLFLFRSWPKAQPGKPQWQCRQVPACWSPIKFTAALPGPVLHDLRS